MDTKNFQVQGTMLIKVMSRASSKVSREEVQHICCPPLMKKLVTMNKLFHNLSFEQQLTHLSTAVKLKLLGLGCKLKLTSLKSTLESLHKLQMVASSTRAS